MPIGALAVAVLVALSGVSAGQDPDKRASAPFVFLGTVKGAAPAGASGATAALLVVVNETYLQKGSFDAQTGREVEVTGAPPNVKTGGQYVFYTEPVRFGARVAVAAIDVVEPGARAAQAGDTMRQQAADDFARAEIRERAGQAEIVMLGTITQITSLQRPPARETEHEPDFRVARVKVERAFKGQPGGSEVEIVFAASRDVQWARAPKFRVGDRGVFFLQAPSQDVVRLGVTRPRYTVLNPLDFRLPRDLSLVESALKGATP